MERNRIERKLAKELGKKFYSNGRPCINGHLSDKRVDNGRCVKCISDYINSSEYKNKKREYEDKNKTSISKRKSEYSKKNREALNEYLRNHRKSNPEMFRKIGKKYASSIKGRTNKKYLSSLRRTRKINATPYWSDLEKIREIYINCPEGFDVDHIIPLVGKDKKTKKHIVCGLHVPWNLQYLIKQENQSKGAFYEQVFCGE